VKRAARSPAPISVLRSSSLGDATRRRTDDRETRQSTEEVHDARYGSSRIRGNAAVDVGVLNIIYGIGALDSANIFTDDRRYVFTNLNTLGWVLIVLGVVQITGGISLFAGNTYGRVIGIVAAGLGAISALLSIGGAYPWWSLAIFALCVFIIHGIFILGDDERSTAT
jgi:hypothetical protein